MSQSKMQNNKALRRKHRNIFGGILGQEKPYYRWHQNYLENKGGKKTNKLSKLKFLYLKGYHQESQRTTHGMGKTISPKLKNK